MAYIDDLPLVLQLDVAGNPLRWITYEDSAYYYAKGLVAWSMGESDFTLRGGQSRMTGQQSSLKINTIIAVQGNMSHTKTRTKFNRVPLTNKTLFRRDHGICAYCGEHFHTSSLTRDHVIPRSKGGPDKWTNVVTACSHCNKIKDDHTPEEAQMELLYVPYAPNRSEYLILMNRKVLTDQMDFLLKQVPKHSRIHQYMTNA